MKRYCIITAALIFVLSLTACQTASTGEETSAEAAAQQEAQVFDPAAFAEALEENQVRAQETYCGNTYRCTGYITEIGDSYAIMNMGYVEIKLNLSKEDLMQLSTDHMAVVSGEITEASYEKREKHIADSTYYSNISSAVMDPAHFESDVVTLSGTIKRDVIQDIYYHPAFHFEMPYVSYVISLESVENVSYDDEKYQFIIDGQEIPDPSNVTISGKVNGTEIEDFKLVSVN